MIASKTRTVLMLIAAATMSHVGNARAQEQAQLADLDALYAQLAADPTTILSAAAGRDALAALDELVLDEGSLEPAHLAKMLLCRIHALLAIGDAGSLPAYMSELRTVQPDAETTHQAAHRVASAMGDGKLGTAALSAMAVALDATGKRNMSTRARRFRIVGSLAPALSVTAADGTNIDFANRDGKALILFLWNVRREPSSDEIAAMQRIYAAQKSNPNVEVVGISANASTQDGKARRFARVHGLSWRHHFEKRGTGAPITHKAFKAGTSPAEIVIDTDGVIRAIGVIGSPAMEYAARAVLAEADGQYPLPPSRGSNGKLTPRGAARVAAAGSGPRGGNRRGQKKPAPALEDNRDAESLMLKARLMLRVRSNIHNAKMLLQRIVREYPNTKQAKQALTMLANLP